MKGLGGYHLAVDAGNAAAAAALRSLRKHREDKPFALMVPDLAAARALCEVDPAAERLLTSSRRPIVLLPRQAGADPAPRRRRRWRPATASSGMMLPYTPLHHLLLADIARPMVADQRQRVR